MKPRLPLNHLNVFASAAEHMSFRGAADRLHVTPSAVSHQVRNLESLLGYTLFERVDKGIRLTSRGQQLFAEIREPLQRLHEASARAADDPDDHLLTVSVAPIFATRWLMPRLRAFQRAHPDIHLSIIATTEVLELSDAGVAAAIRLGDGHWPGSDSHCLFHPRIAAVCHPELLNRVGGRFEPAELAREALVENTGMPGLWEDWFQAADVTPSGQSAALQVQSAAQALEAVQSGDCIALADLHLVADDLASGRIALACAFVHRHGDGYFLVLPTQGARSPARSAFADWLRDEAAAAGRPQRQAAPSPIA